MRLSGARARSVALAGVLAVAGAMLFAARAPVQLVGVSARSDDHGQTILIEATEPVAYAVSQPDPLTVLVEMRDVSVAGAVNRAADLPIGPVRAVHVEKAETAAGSSLARVRLALDAPVAHHVRSARATIQVHFGGESALAAAPAAPAPLVAARPAGSAAVATELSRVRAVADGARVRVTLAGDGRLEPSRVFTESAPARLVLDFAGVRPVAPGVTDGAGTLVERVRVAENSRSPLVTRVVIDLAGAVPYRVERDGAAGHDVAVVFDPEGLEPQAAVAAPGALLTAAPAAAIDPMSALTGQAPAAADVLRAEGPAAPATDSGTVAPRAVVQDAAPQAAAPTAGEQRFTGHPISLDFTDADLRAVLRVFAAESGLNMVIDPAVQGTVDVLLTEVPWDQAMEIILRGSKLGYTVDGTVVRIAPLAVLADEEQARQKLAEAQALAGELAVVTRSLSYAKAANLAPLVINSSLSPRGDVQVDERTNTLIIRDLPANVQMAEQLLGNLDRAEPQVEIEARIVQTNRDFARAIGVQWGVNGRMAPDIGNTSGLAFPNRGVLDGRTGAIQGPADPRATNIDELGSVVNLPVVGATSAIGLMLQSINGSFNLDVALTALERSGKGRILSTPRVTTQNNQPAEVTQGIQIPIQTVANNTVTVTFKDAALKLLVTPQITSADTVIMRVELENAVPDFTRSVNNIPPIDTQRAITQVQVVDGATTVIGGIFVSREQTLNERTPFLWKIPILGWLFKRDSTSDESRELLIFITPRILRG